MREDELAQVAENAENIGEFQRAAKIWDELAMLEHDPILFVRSGRAAAKAKLWTFAENQYEKSLRANPALVESFEAYGSLYLHRDDIARNTALHEAIKWFQKALKIKRTARTLTFLSAALQELGDDLTAASLLDEAILSDSEYVEAFQNLAHLLRKREPDKATSLLERAIELDPSNLRSHQLLGIVSQGAADYQLAEYEFRKCLDLDPNDYWSHIYLANFFAVKGDTGQATKYFNKARGLEPLNSAGNRIIDKYFAQGH